MLCQIQAWLLLPTFIFYLLAMSFQFYFWSIVPLQVVWISYTGNRWPICCCLFHPLNLIQNLISFTFRALKTCNSSWYFGGLLLLLFVLKTLVYLFLSFIFKIAILLGCYLIIAQFWWYFFLSSEVHYFPNSQDCVHIPSLSRDP